MARLYLIPTSLGEDTDPRLFPIHNAEVIATLRHFIVENIRSARRFLKKIVPDIDIDQTAFHVLDEHTPLSELDALVRPLTEGHDVGLLSEAGCPAVADPGAEVVALAQRHGHIVTPLVGPSAILLALMGSGFNGQHFAFTGYLPVAPADRQKALRRLESRAYAENQTQLFIEAPYRNMKMLDDILRVCRADTRLCIAADLTLRTEYIRTHTIKEWKQQALPNLNKRPCIFLIYK